MNTARSAGPASAVARLRPSPNVVEITYCAWARFATTGCALKVVGSVNLFPTVKTRVARPGAASLQVVVSAKPAFPVKVEFRRALPHQCHCCKRAPDVFGALTIRSTHEGGSGSFISTRSPKARRIFYSISPKGVERHGCPTLAALLFLRLGWDTSPLYSNRKNLLVCNRKERHVWHSIGNMD
jgi:hypothetical protein